MGMVLEHQLAATYGAGSLGGTLGRLAEAVRRLSRWRHMGRREKPGGTVAAELIGPADLARLNQTLRLMADAWQSRRTPLARFSNLEKALETMKENVLATLGPRRRKTERRSDYQQLAQALDRIISGDSRNDQEL